MIYQVLLSMLYRLTLLRRDFRRCHIKILCSNQSYDVLPFHLPYVILSSHLDFLSSRCVLLAVNVSAVLVPPRLGLKPLRRAVVLVRQDANLLADALSSKTFGISFDEHDVEFMEWL